MNTLSTQTKLQLPTNTRITSHDASIVITSVAGSKTISGEHASVCASLLDGCDGATPLSELTDHPTEVTRAVAQGLYEAGIVYPTEFLAPLDLDDRFRGLFESILLSLDPSARESFADMVADTRIELRGDEFLVDRLLTSLRSVDWTVSSSDTLSEPDVILLAETPATSTDTRTAANRTWRQSDSVLVRVGLDGEELSVGPFLSPSAQACLECLTTREQMNDTRVEFDYETLNPGITPTTWVLQPIAVQMTTYAATSMIPPSLEGKITTLGIPTMEYRESRLLGVPGCETCGR